MGSTCYDCCSTRGDSSASGADRFVHYSSGSRSCCNGCTCYDGCSSGEDSFILDSGCDCICTCHDCSTSDDHRFVWHNWILVSLIRGEPSGEPISGEPIV